MNANFNAGCGCGVTFNLKVFHQPRHIQHGLQTLPSGWFAIVREKVSEDGFKLSRSASTPGRAGRTGLVRADTIDGMQGIHT